MVGVPERFSCPEFKRLFIFAEIGTFTPEQYRQYMTLNADAISEMTKMAVLEVEKILNQKQNTTKPPASLLDELHA